MSTLPLRIGVVGAGGICKSAHFPGFAKVEACKVVAVCNRSPESSRKVAQEFSIPEIETNWKKLVARKDLNVILVGTWPNLHRDVTVAALKAGKHVLCESRMAWDAAHARAMLAAAKEAKRKHGLVSMLCPPPLGFKGDYVMQELLASGMLGTPYHLYIRSTNSGFLDPTKPLHWRQMKKFQGLNALTLGMLNEPVQRWFGDTLRVQASTRTFTKRRPVAEGSRKLGRVERPDCIGILADMQHGLQATYLFSGVAAHGGPNVVEAFGSAGMIRYVLGADRIFAAGAGDAEPREIPIPEEKARTWKVEAEFASAIREGTPVTPNFEAGVKYMQFTEAVDRSAASGRAVVLPR